MPNFTVLSLFPPSSFFDKREKRNGSTLRFFYSLLLKDVSKLTVYRTTFSNLDEVDFFKVGKEIKNLVYKLDVILIVFLISTLKITIVT